MSHIVDPRIVLQQIFTAVNKNETVVNLSDGPFPLIHDGQAITVCISQITETFESANPASTWAALMQKENPIHSYLFDQTGHLQYANVQARNKWNLQGENVRSFTLEQLLIQDGRGCPVLLVSSLDVTHQRQLELNLEAAKDQLQRQNLCLEASKTRLEADQAKLEAQQAALKARLQQALQMTTIPKTNIDTVTVADKAVRLLDRMIEGDVPELEVLVAVRNAMVRETDLRQPMDLGEQLMHSSGLADDVGQAMVDLLQGDSHSSAKQVAKAQKNALSRGTTMRSSLMRPKRFSGSRQLSRDISQRLYLSSLQRSSSLADAAAADDPADHMSNYVDAAIIPHVESLLQEAADSWTFSIFDLSDATTRPLSTLAFFLLKGTGLMDIFQLEEEVVACFLRELEDGYLDNPYHSSTHAAGVLQMIHMLVQNGLIQSGVLDDSLQLSCYMAAICHDYAHPGLTNDFLIKTCHRTALVYNDNSPLENMHVSSSFQVMYNSPGAFFMAPIPRDTRDVLRASLIDLVLGTDMKKHFSTLSRFQAILPARRSSCSASGTQSHSIATPEAADAGAADNLPLASLPPDQKLLVAQMALKAADISHLAAPVDVHRKWTAQLTEEFFRQGDRERSLNMKISPLMDRNDSAGMVKSQVGFFEIVALPLFNGFVELIPDARPMLDGVMANYEYWHSQQIA
ncbi:hypothetical protein WJX74_004848 [Apatococcus lobatus]|uniref:Phosphodiesterase n=1 Tax=Apatococcus lobatus TaxID=904363 RepID=A0AAW1SA27_9CHLO